MNNEEEFNKCIKNCYNIYINKGFEGVVNYCYSFGIDYNEYKKDISKKICAITNNTINTFKLVNVDHLYKEYKNYIKINTVYKNVNYASTKAKLQIPVSINNFERAISVVLKYIIEKKCNCSIKLSKIYCSELLVITFEDCSLINSFIEFYNNSEELKKERKIDLISIIPNISGIGVCSEIYPYNYLNTFNNYICTYYMQLDNEEEVSYSSLILFLERIKKSEKNILKKEMISIIVNCIKTITSKVKAYSIFDYNGEMNIGSYNPAEYRLLINENRIIYFESKENGLQIFFGSEDYLNLCYSFFYKNVISKNSSEMYYSYFRNIYINLLEKRYFNMKELFNIDVGEDIIYKELTLMASCYFAYKKMSFEFKELNIILKKVIEENLKCSATINSSEMDISDCNISMFPFNLEYASKLVILKDKTVIKIIDYFNKNEVLKYIPLNSILNLKNGNGIQAEEFLKKIYEIIPKYESFKELIDNNIDFIEYNN